jgi:hypothetical protein
MKNEISAFKKLIENQTAFEYFNNSVNIFADSKIKTRGELAEYVENNHTSEQLKNIILEYLAVQREKIEKVDRNITQKGRNYTAGGSVLFVKINKLEALKNEIIAILNEPDDLDLEIFESVLEILESAFEATHHPDPKGAAKEALKDK